MEPATIDHGVSQQSVHDDHTDSRSREVLKSIILVSKIRHGTTDRHLVLNIFVLHTSSSIRLLPRKAIK